MTDITIQKLTKAQKDQVRYLYLGNYEASDIATKLNVEIETVRFMIFGEDGTGKNSSSLFSIKKGMSSSAISSFLIDRAAILDRIAGTVTNIISKSLSDLQIEVLEKGKELNMGELKTLTDILTNLDKIVRLETGKATENVSHLGLSVSEAREYLINDPFSKDFIDVESQEIKENKELPWLVEKK